MSSYRIVLADDHALVRQGIKKIICEDEDLEVVGEAADGLELLSLLNSVVPHLVILDMSMPNLRGIECVSEIKTKHPFVKVLVLTMHKEYLHQALSKGADGYLLKEDVDGELFSAIEKIRQGRIAISPLLTEKILSRVCLPSDSLSLREREVLQLIAGGKSNKDIAKRLSISVRTVESHRAALLKKLELRSTAALVNYAFQNGYV
jgi:DNA-binding NarL/FixJ family response regulator